MCGWNPMNQNVLYLPEVIGKIINKNIKEDTMASYIARSVQSTINNLTKNISTYDVKFSALSVREIYLNFGTGTSGSML